MNGPRGTPPEHGRIKGGPGPYFAPGPMSARDGPVCIYIYMIILFVQLHLSP